MLLIFVFVVIYLTFLVVILINSCVFSLRDVYRFFAFFRHGRDSSVGIGTRFGMDGPEFESRSG
jgi:hypothetical protein